MRIACLRAAPSCSGPEVVAHTRFVAPAAASLLSFLLAVGCTADEATDRATRATRAPQETPSSFASGEIVRVGDQGLTIETDDVEGGRLVVRFDLAEPQAIRCDDGTTLDRESLGPGQQIDVLTRATLESEPPIAVQPVLVVDCAASGMGRSGVHPPFRTPWVPSAGL